MGSSSMHFSIRCGLCPRDFNMLGQATLCGGITVLQCGADLQVHHAQIPSALYVASCTMDLTHHNMDGMVAAMVLVVSSPHKAPLRNAVDSSKDIRISWATTWTQMLEIASWSAPLSAAIARS